MAKSKVMLCKNCGYVGDPKVFTSDYFAVELILWCMLFIPGLAYSLWRIHNRTTMCRQSNEKNMIPADSPFAQKILNDLQPSKSQPPPVKPKKESEMELPERDENGRFIIPE